MSPSFLTSPLLPVVHGFTTRQGGVSPAPQDSLNLGFSVGDAPEAVEENFRRLGGRIGVAPARFCRVSQVHGAIIHPVGAPPDAGEALLPAPLAEADGLWSGVGGLALGILTADCVPLLLVDPEGGRVAAVHSGWKGTLLGIGRVAVEALVREGARPGQLLAAIGPCIRPCCYQVDAALAARFAATFGEGVSRADGGAHARLDLVGALRRTLAGAGVRPGNVDALGDCTACDPARFFSHRRDAGRTGRMLSFVVVPGAPGGGDPRAPGPNS